MPSLQKKVFLGAISLLLVAMTMYMDASGPASALHGNNDVPKISLLEKGKGGNFSPSNDSKIEVASGPVSRLVLGIGDNALLRLAPETSLSLAVSKGPAPIEMQLTGGRVWINTINSLQAFTIKTSLVTLELPPGVFDIHYEEGNLIIAALKRSAFVAIMGNALVVPEGNELILSESKISRAKEHIAKLRYSKLFKEFPFSALPDADEWVSLNATQDDRFNQSYEKMRKNEIRSRGPILLSTSSNISSMVQASLSDAIIALTLDSKRREARETKAIFKYLDAAAYAALFVGGEEARALLSQFESHARLSDSSLLQSEAWTQSLNKRREKMAFAMPEDDLFTVRSALRAFEGETPLKALSDAMTDIIDANRRAAGDETVSRVRSFLQTFASVAQAKIAQFVGDDLQKAFLLSVVYDDFIQQNPFFLREEFLRTAAIFERMHLASISDNELLTDQRNYFLGEKLKRIGVIRTLAASAEIPFQDARKAILLLAAEIEAVKPDLTAAAIGDYFDTKLEELTPFLSYLRSTRAENLRGSFTEDFAKFQQDTDEIRKVNELLGDSDGGTEISPFRREELAAIISKDIGKLGLKKMKIVLPAVEGDPRVRIVSSEFEGAFVSGLYDTSRKILSEVVFNNEQLPNAIRVENIRQFFLIKSGKESLPAGTTAERLMEKPSQESLLEKVARATVKKELDAMKIELEEKNLGLEDIDKNIVHVRLATIGQGPSTTIEFACDIDVKQMTVSKMRVKTVIGELPVNSTFKFSELALRVETIYKQAQIDKEREEELKKAVDTAPESPPSVQP